VSEIADIKISLLDKKVGDVVQLRILRDQETLTVPVELSGLENARGLPSDQPKP
jgi:S1-C subfamily serine protease